VDQQTPFWSAKPASARREHISQYVAFTAGLKATVAVIEDLYDTWHEAPEGDIQSIEGETRAGKTTSVDEWMINKHAEVVLQYAGRDDVQVLPLGDDSSHWAITIKTPTGFLRPVVKIQVDKKPRYKSLFADVLATMGFPGIPDKMTSDQRLKLLATQIRDQKTRVIIFDEVHHISEYKNPDGAYDAGDVFKTLAKTARCQVLLVGLPHMMEIADANSQVRELMKPKHTVEPFKLDLEPTSDLKQFLISLNQELPFDQPSCLDDDEVILRIGVLNENFVGRIAKFVHQVVHFAIAKDLPCVNVEALTSFLRDKRQVADESNVFLLNREGVGEYPAFVEQHRRERLLAAENRRAKAAQQRRTKTAFGARGQ